MRNSGDNTSHQHSLQPMIFFQNDGLGKYKRRTRESKLHKALHLVAMVRQEYAHGRQAGAGALHSAAAQASPCPLCFTYKILRILRQCRCGRLGNGKPRVGNKARAGNLTRCRCVSKCLCSSCLCVCRNKRECKENEAPAAISEPSLPSLSTARHFRLPCPSASCKTTATVSQVLPSPRMTHRGY